MKPAKGSVPCVCGHDHAAHQHYRSGSECSLCECPRWRPNRGLRRFAVLMQDRLSKLPAKYEKYRPNYVLHNTGRVFADGAGRTAAAILLSDSGADRPCDPITSLP